MSRPSEQDQPSERGAEPGAGWPLPSGGSRLGIPANRCVSMGVTFTEAAAAGMALRQEWPRVSQGFLRACVCSGACWLSEGASSRISSEVRLGEEIG